MVDWALVKTAAGKLPLSLFSRCSADNELSSSRATGNCRVSNGREKEWLFSERNKASISRIDHDEDNDKAKETASFFPLSSDLFSIHLKCTSFKFYLERSFKSNSF